MDVTLEGCARETLDPGLLDRAARRVEATVPTTDRVQLVIAGDFVSSVRARAHGEEEDGNQYKSDRTFGVAAAKTIPRYEGFDLVVDARVINGEFGEVDVERLVAHESWHIALHQRGESLNDLRIRHALPALSREGYLAAISGIAAEEFRVERALCEADWWPETSYREGISESLGEFRAAILDGINLRYPGEPVERCCRTVLTSFHHISMLVSYLGAEEVAAEGQRPSIEGSSQWERLVGDSWSDLLESLRPIPPASQPTDLASLDQQTLALGSALERWLQRVGFTIRNEGGGIYFDVLTHDF